MNGRKNAMLTTEDRRWLTGEKSYEGKHAKQQRYQRRRDIRQRVQSTILDFTILFEHLEEAERAKLFENRSRTENDDEAFTNGLRDALAFVLYGTGITESMVGEDAGRRESPAERLLEAAVARAGAREEILVEDVDLTIDAVRAPVDAIVRELRAGNDVSTAELCLLIESDEVDAAVVQDCLREVLSDDD